VRGTPGETYNVGGWNEKKNPEVVHAVCDLPDEAESKPGDSYRAQIPSVKDRPGRNHRDAFDARRLGRELGWRPVETFETGLAKTVQRYLDIGRGRKK
jgi:dTDP-glucose 4,6-dehydratase